MKQKQCSNKFGEDFKKMGQIKKKTTLKSPVVSNIPTLNNRNWIFKTQYLLHQHQRNAEKVFGNKPNQTCTWPLHRKVQNSHVRNRRRSKWMERYSLFMDLLFSCSVVSDSLRPHGLQHARPPCPSPSTGACSNSSPWVGDAIQPSHPLSSPSALKLSQHQGLF